MPETGATQNSGESCWPLPSLPEEGRKEGGREGGKEGRKEGGKKEGRKEGRRKGRKTPSQSFCSQKSEISKYLSLSPLSVTVTPLLFCFEGLRVSKSVACHGDISEFQNG